MRRKIFISGISRGLGRALFDNLLRRNLFPIGIGRNFDRIQKEAARQLLGVLVSCDLSLEDELDSLDLDALVGNNAQEVVFISNAGVIKPIGMTRKLERKAIARSLMVNLQAPLALAQALVVAARKRDIPMTIINVSSGAANRPIAGWAAYCVGKAAASMMFKCLAAEEPSVSVFDIDPGVLSTEMQVEIRAASCEEFPARADFVSLHDQGRLRDPAVVANEIVTQWVLK